MIPMVQKLTDPVVQKPVAPVAPLSSALSTSSDPGAPLNLSSTTPLAPAVPIAPAALVSATPEFTANSAPVKPVEPASLLFDSPRASEAQASFLEPAKSPAVPLTPSVSNLLSLFEAKPAVPAAVPPPPAPPSSDPETEALRQHTPRLQEQLSGMQFSVPQATPPTVTVQIPQPPPLDRPKELPDSPPK